jgi:hypothetical protein
MPLGFLFIPEGCLIIAQLFKLGSLGKSGLSREGTTESVSSAVNEMHATGAVTPRPHIKFRKRVTQSN